MPHPLQAVVAGHICLDIFPDFESQSDRNLAVVLKPGSLVQVGAACFSSGGPVSNTGLALHRLGVPVRLIAKIGADPFGRILKERVASWGPHLEDGLITDPQGVTSYSIILSNRTTDRIFLHCTGENDTFGPEDIDYRLVEQADLFHFGYPPALRRMYSRGGRDFAAIMRFAKETGATTSLDMSLPDPNTESGKADWRPIYQSVLPYVDIFLPSLDELFYTLQRDAYHRMAARGEILRQADPILLEDLSSELLGLGVKIAAVKLGDRGVYLRTASEEALKTLGRARPIPGTGWGDCERWVPCYEVDVVGTTGAGDSTIAGFLAGLLRRTTVEEALTMAVAVGACNVEAADSLSGLRTWEATRDRVRAGWMRLPFKMEAAGWRWVETHGAWIGPKDAARQGRPTTAEDPGSRIIPSS
jgi:sugar/nucleoside kinase (ribokinase family)